MAGNLNALGLIAMIALTITVIAGARRRRVTLRHLLVGIGISLLVAVIAATLSAHLCRSGQPFTQWLIPGICLVAVLSLVEIPKPRRIAASVLAAGAIALSFHFSELVHWRGYTGNPGGGNVVRILYMHKLQEALEEWRERDLHSINGAVLPNGWLRNVLSFDDEAALEMLDRLQSAPEYSHFWHTWLTGIYRVYLVPTDIWYPGGPLTEGLKRLELRERSDRSP